MRDLDDDENPKRTVEKVTMEIWQRLTEKKLIKKRTMLTGYFTDRSSLVFTIVFKK